MAEDAPAVSGLEEAEPLIRVSTLELFFDLVFVFTFTQLTRALVHHLDAAAVVQAMLMFGLIWWMYGGYAWLTNAMAPDSVMRRTLLLVGMGGFLVVALAVPEAFGASGWAFGAGYLVVSVMHSLLLHRASGAGARAVLTRLAPINLTSALLVLVGGLLPGWPRYALWAVALALQIATPYLHRMEAHSVNAGHFVERHGLVVIIAIGESIIAIGMGFEGLELDFGAIVVALLGLGTAYYLWWTYFSLDQERSEHALQAAAEPRRRSLLALYGWGYAHYPLLLGVVFLSAGTKKTVGHAFEPLAWGPATVLGAGAAMFLLGHAWFLRVLALDGARYRCAAAAGVLLTIPLAHVVAVAQLVAVPIVMAASAITEDSLRIRRTRTNPFTSFGRTASH
ncbi:low temperature requirement protein LtrA [Actinocorallia herbida]|uniref:Low temperature requirement protein LtrA n=1 Tax=Actinocorallia herbida TaxID=58109 RepID=A0A3N1D5V0_9ACTN|nr:low temperature requirement protein A [Actinocorallia herbida]ROO88913.1 low temperature requirement protein LtrA [Actinocorallia herbida]